MSFEAGTIFNEPCTSHSLSPSSSRGNRTHLYTVNSLEVNKFFNVYWDNEEAWGQHHECFEDIDLYTSNSDHDDDTGFCNGD